MNTDGRCDVCRRPMISDHKTEVGGVDVAVLLFDYARLLDSFAITASVVGDEARAEELNDRSCHVRELAERFAQEAGWV